MGMLEGKTVVLGVSGSISAYKSANLASLLMKQGARVRVVMTEAATKFISDLTFEALTHEKVPVGCAAEAVAAAREAGQAADVVIVAPLSANTAARLALGLSDGVVCAAVQASTSPVLVAPAMNSNMLANAATQENLDTLAARGVTVIPSASGTLACGAVGAGKLPSETMLRDYVIYACATTKDLAGKHVLVTAGPTQESIDPVRYITNHSTGRMGFAIAKRAAMRGAKVTLVAGQVNLDTPLGVERVDIVSAQDMFEAVTSCAPECDAIIKAAAVADYRPKSVASDKVKKKDGDMAIELERTQDILAWLGAHRIPGQRLCGFSMETRDVLENSRAKLTRKNVDMICANCLKEDGAGFGTATNHLTLITHDGEVDLPLMDKEEAADRLLTELFALPVD
ncbi:bifunctional phosphopantothenoylcysteine decarboxylase/phosphopantothenate--cysteine ligase CoaBC [uncultured Slackia sp.]|uniref:bifunctional phosphopantothenoylcysteine decarboxylase/phosphopantothenate--cysteine ligase CoaBC n=1 Tax=uncultured Slackia sp. TaxID=665903 RepID=UPI0025F0A49C|nr:bifunctional phosphopantothenoylcysteine decarboxylase/phosphopantothenate--cysteine ligase CoaBC [uncultured Slackia sp.]